MSNFITLNLFKRRGVLIMSDSQYYVPTLKWKRGERRALERIDSSEQQKMIPLIEIQPVPFDHKAGDFSKTIDEHLENVGAQLKEVWHQNTPVLIDLYTLYDNEDFEDDLLQDGQHPVKFVVNSINSFDIPAIPVTGIDRPEEFQTAVRSVSQNGICIRLTQNELSNFQKLRKELEELLAFFNVTHNEVDIILDYKQIYPNQEELIYQHVLLTIAQFPFLTQWRTLTLSMTSFPKNLNSIPTNSNGELPRTEWKIYKRIHDCGLARIPIFGDYGISHPDFVNLDPRIITMASKIVYSYDDLYLIFRGGSVKKHGFSQSVQLANDLISLPQFCGADFSFGDNYIYECANGDAKPGNAETWVMVGVNHHLTLVARDLSNLRAVSTVN